MADPPAYPDSNDDTNAGSVRGSTAGRSRWVYALWTIGIVLVLLVVVLHLTGTIGPASH
jgi:hypothetical protein